ncbi:LysR substrate-binding domain-containing protein [Streptomyces sp. NPDC021224]|uniref:LysR substrate-binding domain-containing protein n=1 Tax=unclassified Streptomyces TaxID=2593676 RepID=UPI00379438D2
MTPSKWVRIWAERLPDVPLELVAVPPVEAAGLLRARGADAGLLRLPVDRTDLSAIPLYTETTVVIVPKDHFVAAAEEIALADLADELVLHPVDDTLGWERPPGRPALERPATTADAVELVAAGVGVLVVPQSLARLHHRRDLTYRTVADAPQSQVALSWREDATTDLVDDFIGIVRGRTANSTRGRRAAAEQAAPAKAATGGGSGAGRKKPAKPGSARTSAGKGARTSAAPRRGKPRRRS